MALHTIRHWVFDMDGTLTVAIHDFDAIRKELGLEADVPILEAISRRDQAQQLRLHEHLAALELEIARQSTVAPGCFDLLEHLRSQGHGVAILTRNTRANAFETLRAVGLDAYFPAALVLGRDEAPPKPSAGGVSRILEQLNADRRQSAMVGDYLFDLQAGRAAGVLSVHVAPKPEPAWSQWTDVHVEDLHALRNAL